MSNPHGIIVFGANGSGKSTLARELAGIMGYKHMDIEDYHFLPSDIPYTKERSREECLHLMLADIEAHRSFVLSAVTGDFGDTIPQFYVLGVYLSAPLELRVERIKQREYDKHGLRVQPGGDMYEQCLAFIDFVASRSLARIDQWAATLPCPVIRVDGTVDCRVSAAGIAGIIEQYQKMITAK